MATFKDGTVLTLGTIGALAVAGLVRERGSQARGMAPHSDDSRIRLRKLVKNKATVTVEVPVQMAVNLIADGGDIMGDEHMYAAMEIQGLVHEAMEKQYGVDTDDIRDFWNAG